MGVFALLARRATSGPAVDDRLSQFAGRQAEVRAEKAQTRPFAALDAAVSKGKRGGQMSRNLARADLKLTVTEFIGIKVLAAAVGIVFGVILGRASPLAQIAAAI